MSWRLVVMFFSGRWIFARPLTLLWAKSQKPTRREEMWFFVRHINLPKPKRFYQQAKHQLWHKLFFAILSASRLCPRCFGWIGQRTWPIVKVQDCRVYNVESVDTTVTVLLVKLQVTMQMFYSLFWNSPNIAEIQTKQMGSRGIKWANTILLFAKLIALLLLLILIQWSNTNLVVCQTRPLTGSSVDC